VTLCPNSRRVFGTDWELQRTPPAEIIEKLNGEVNRALSDPKITARLTELGCAPLVGSPADLRKLIAAEVEKWGKVIRAANIKPE
jgi:tripartite-type tricarboxylate transporter receptor subunit TctC